MKQALEDIILQLTYPRIDAEVSKHRNHLLKAPFCVHPKTGRVCVPIDPEKIDEFDPELVPTVGQLLRELDAVGSEPAGEEHSGLSFSNRMMPMVNQRSHHFRLGKNLVEAIC